MRTFNLRSTQEQNLIKGFDLQEKSCIQIAQVKSNGTIARFFQSVFVDILRIHISPNSCSFYFHVIPVLSSIAIFVNHWVIVIIYLDFVEVCSMRYVFPFLMEVKTDIRYPSGDPAHARKLK